MQASTRRRWFLWRPTVMSLFFVLGLVAHSDAQPPRPVSPGRPRHDQARNLARQGQLAQAISEYREAIKLDPNIVESRNDLAWILATSDNPAVRNPQEAVNVAERLVDDVIRGYVLRRQLAPGAAAAANPYAGLPNPPHFYKVTVIRTLAAAYAAAGRYSPPDANNATTTATARALASAAGCAAPAAVPYAQLASQAAVAENRKRPNAELRGLVTATAQDVRDYRAGTAKRLARPIS